MADILTSDNEEQAAILSTDDPQRQELQVNTDEVRQFLKEKGMQACIEDLPAVADTKRVIGRLLEIPSRTPTAGEFLVMFEAAKKAGVGTEIIEHAEALAVDVKYSYAIVAEDALCSIGNPMALMLRKRRREAEIEKRRASVSDQPVIRGCFGEH